MSEDMPKEMWIVRMGEYGEYMASKKPLRSSSARKFIRYDEHERLVALARNGFIINEK